MSMSERRSITRGNTSTDPVALSNFLVSQLERQGLSANSLPTRQSDWDWFLRSVDRAFADVSALEVQSSRANNLVEEELTTVKETLKQQTNQLSIAQQEFELSQRTLNSAGLGCFILDPQTANVQVNSTLAGMLGLDKEQVEMPLAVMRHSFSDQDQRVLFDSISKVYTSSEHLDMEFRPVTVGTEEKWFTCRLTSFKLGDGQPRKVLGILQDVTRVHRAEQNASQLASFDQLTRVCNRQHFFSYCRDRMASRGGAEEPFALLYLDLDGFKDLNDSHGHKLGDQLLQLIATRITGCIPDPNCVARYGADEFLILIKNACDARHIETIANILLKQIGKPVQLEETELSVTASIGVTFFPAHGNTLDRLLQNADTALNRAKKSAKNSWMVFDESLNSELSARFAMINRLRNAIAKKELDLAFQPLVNGETNQVHSVEALARWYDSEHGPISPAIFIPLAESCGLIESIGQFVLRQALKTLKGWDLQGAAPITLSVNFSAIQFSNPNFVEMIRDVLAEHRLPANRLQVEITETMMLEDMESCRVKLQDLRRLGVSIAIDDFGTGYSSLGYLESLPIDCIKIDKSFVDKIVDVDQRLPMIEAVMAIAKSLGMYALAEGVETSVQRRALLRMGCQMMQGYYFHRPMSDFKMGELLLREPAMQAT
jgi:diguanylate cyclase (GGDEF)-like protein